MPGAAAPSDNVFVQILSSFWEKESGPLNPQMDVCVGSPKELVNTYPAGQPETFGAGAGEMRKPAESRAPSGIYSLCMCGAQ